MSFTVDYITMAPKSQEVSQIQQTEHTRNEQGHQQMAGAFGEQIRKNSEQTVRRAKTENEQPRYEEKQNQQNKKGKEQGKKQEKTLQSQDQLSEEGKKKFPLSEGGSFDMRI